MTITSCCFGIVVYFIVIVFTGKFLKFGNAGDENSSII